MSNQSIKINLKKFRNAALLTIPGRTAKKRCICIPVDDNPEIFVGEKGVYLDLTAIEMKEPGQYGDTHFLKGNSSGGGLQVPFRRGEEVPAHRGPDASPGEEGAAGPGGACSGTRGRR